MRLNHHLNYKILSHMLLPLHLQFCEGVAPGEANVKDCLELHMWVPSMHGTFAAPDCSSPIWLQHPTMLAWAADAAHLRTPAHVWYRSCCAALRCAAFTYGFMVSNSLQVRGRLL